MQLIVFGMHRSGTSMVTRIVNMMGAYIGSRERIMEPGTDNQHGFWERTEVVALNDTILKAGGGTWWDVVGYTQRAIDEESFTEITREIAGIVEELDRRRPWVVKDPRMCVTFPLWRQAMREPICINVYRSPLGVARSLQRRNGFPIGMGLGLWEAYSLHAVDACRGIPGCLVDFSELMTEPVSATERLYNDLQALGVRGLRLPRNEEIYEYIEAPTAVSKDEAADEDEYLNERQKVLAEYLQSGSAPPVEFCTPSEGGLDAQRSYFYTQQLERQAGTAPNRSGEAYREARDIQRQVTEFEARCEALRLRIGGGDVEDDWRELKRQHQDNVRALGDRLQESEERTEKLREWLAELDRNLSEIFVSWRWRVGHGVMSVIERLLFRGKVGLAKDHVMAILARFRGFDSQIKEPVLSELSLERSTTREQFADVKHRELRAFLQTGETLTVPPVSAPKVSIILVLFNRAELTLWCLTSIAENTDLSYEVIVVDNGSNDETGLLVDRIEGAKVIHNEGNLGFVRAVNQGAEIAAGQYLLLLNNDSRILAGSIRAAVDTLERERNAGVVGGKLLMLDGRVQEGGSIIWDDGSCLGYGRGKTAWAPEVMFRRDVDYCSGAFLITPRALFKEMGGFDERFSPAYYEDTDYCTRIKEKGFRIIYEPNACVVHFEFASSRSREDAVKLQQRNRRAFYDKHGAWLRNCCPPRPQNVLRARSGTGGKGNILYIDDRVPHKSLGAGFPRANLTIRTLVGLGYHVTVYPLNFPYEDRWDTVYEDIPREVEVMLGYGRARLRGFIKDRAGYYDVVMISRPHNMDFFNRVVGRESTHLQSTKIVYDAEALFALRDLEHSRADGKSVSLNKTERRVGREIEIAREGDIIFAVTDRERQYFLERNRRAAVYVLGHAIEDEPTAASFQERSGLLFVGNLVEDKGPNVDSLLWFVGEVLPRVRSEIGDVRLDVVGTCRSSRVIKLENDHVRIHGRVKDLHAFYEHARVFIAPTRFAAGIPYKVHEAGARGLPVVATDILAAQLEWDNGVELLSAAVNDAFGFAAECVRLYSDEGLWRTVRRNALSRVEAECSRTRYTNTLKQAFEKLLSE